MALNRKQRSVPEPADAVGPVAAPARAADRACSTRFQPAFRRAKGDLFAGKTRWRQPGGRFALAAAAGDLSGRCAERSTQGKGGELPCLCPADRCHGRSTETRPADQFCTAGRSTAQKPLDYRDRDLDTRSLCHPRQTRSRAPFPAAADTAFGRRPARHGLSRHCRGFHPGLAGAARRGATGCCAGTAQRPCRQAAGSRTVAGGDRGQLETAFRPDRYQLHGLGNLTPPHTLS